MSQAAVQVSVVTSAAFFRGGRAGQPAVGSSMSCEPPTPSCFLWGRWRPRPGSRQPPPRGASGDEAEGAGQPPQDGAARGIGGLSALAPPRRHARVERLACSAPLASFGRGLSGTGLLFVAGVA